MMRVVLLLITFAGSVLGLRSGCTWFPAIPLLRSQELQSSASPSAAPERPDSIGKESKKYTQKNLMRNVGALSGVVPSSPVEAPRPSLYKPTPVKSSGGSGGKRVMPQGQTREREISNPNRLRIIAGTAKGKKIDSPNVYLRPMMAKVREALFSTLGHLGAFETGTLSVLDVFSGSGSVGLEALSRGAGTATFVDLSSDCVSTVLRNAASCGFEGRVSTVCARAEDVFTNPGNFGLTQSFGLISITPPYEEIVYSELIEAVCKSPLVAENTLVVIEYPVEMGTLPQILGNDKLFGIRNRRYGRTVLGIYVYRPTRKYEMKPEEFLSL